MPCSVTVESMMVPYIMSQMGEKDMKKQYHKEAKWENFLLRQHASTAIKSLVNSEKEESIYEL